MSIKITGLNELQNKIRDIQKRGQELNGETQVTFEELFPTTFMIKYTNFKTIDKLFESSGFKIETAEDFLSIPENELDKFISENTSFLSWIEMRDKAVVEWTAKKLGLDC